MFDPDTLGQSDREEWFRLIAAATRAADALRLDRANGQDHSWRSEVWSKIKAFLLRVVFYEKCAYCESDIMTVYVGDAEHYRPKGSVTQRIGGKEMVVRCEAGHPHPGYYWLAYNWRNILPACYMCNTNHGKGAQFPAKKHACSPDVAEDPDVLDKIESPFLLHPLRADYKPSDHFIFDDFGGIEPRDGDELAEITIDVFDLRRAALRDRRMDQQKLAWDIFKKARDEAAESNGPLGDPLRYFREGRKPHSVAALQYVARMLDRESRLSAEAHETALQPITRSRTMLGR